MKHNPIEFGNAFEGLKILSMTNDNQAHAFLCETTNHGLKPFYVVVMYLFDDYHGKTSFDTKQQAQHFIDEWVKP